MRSDLDTTLNDFIAAAAYIDRGGAANLHSGAAKLKDGAAAMQRLASDLSKSLL
jgi:X-X-X-Leu-X-X-Gly heptad repeat protein